MKAAPTGITQTPSPCNQVAGVFLFYGELVLLCRRCLSYEGNPVSYGGYWSPFTGMVEEGESSLEAGVRELYEESGKKITPFDLTYMEEIPREDSSILLYACELDDFFSPELDAEHTEYGYFKIDTLHTSPTPVCPSMVRAVQDFNTNRRYPGW